MVIVSGIGSNPYFLLQRLLVECDRCEYDNSLRNKFKYCVKNAVCNQIICHVSCLLCCFFPGVACATSMLFSCPAGYRLVCVAGTQPLR